jgi:hypothetical protein
MSLNEALWLERQLDARQVAEHKLEQFQKPPTLWYALLREDSQTPILIHWDKNRVEQLARSDNYRMVAVAPLDKNGIPCKIEIRNKE